MKYPFLLSLFLIIICLTLSARESIEETSYTEPQIENLAENSKNKSFDSYKELNYFSKQEPWSFLVYGQTQAKFGGLGIAWRANGLYVAWEVSASILYKNDCKFAFDAIYYLGESILKHWYLGLGIGVTSAFSEDILYFYQGNMHRVRNFFGLFETFIGYQSEVLFIDSGFSFINFYIPSPQLRTGLKF